MADDIRKQAMLYEVTRSEDRKVKILEAMLDKDIDRVCELLREAIERAYEKERTNISP